MSNLAMLKTQHTEVLTIMNSIDALIKKGDFDAHAKNIAYNINTLSGKLKIHLMPEDKFLYPNLISSNNENIKYTAQSFYDEMGNAADIFSSFVQKYNVPSKILQDRENFYKAKYKLII